MKFVHTADIHLDSPLHGLAAYPDAPVDNLRNATRLAFSELVTRAVEEGVDFMVIAGDLYDGSWRDFNTGMFFTGEMGRLKRANIPVFVLHGNHDAESEMTKRLDLPDNVHVFSYRNPQTFRLDDLKVALHGQSYKDAATTANLAIAYPQPVSGYYNIGVLHTALEGSAAHANYAPCTRQQLHAKGYQYWALGHVHEFSEWAEASTIVFPGNLQGRNIRETGRRGAVLVTVDTDGRTTVERVFVDVLRWEAISVDASDCASLTEVSRKVGTAFEEIVGHDTSVPRAVRVTVMGRTNAHGALFGLEAQLRNEVLNHIAAIGNEKLWLEKVQIRTEPPLDTTADEHRLDAFADLQQILNEAESDPELLKALQEDLMQLATRAPLELHALVPDLDKVRSGQVVSLVQSVSPALLAHLAQGE